VAIPLPVWITGSVRSGKTEALIAQVMQWQQPLHPMPQGQTNQGQRGHTTLVFAANAENHSALMQRMAQQGQAAITATTPIAFFESEAQLFWPLVIQRLNLRGYFPYPLRPETEQVLDVSVVRALLTLLTLVYPKLGYLVAPDQVAEMLIVLSAQADPVTSRIDPVRAGLLADYCFRPHPEHPAFLYPGSGHSNFFDD
jgi:hypothetical protein